MNVLVDSRQFDAALKEYIKHSNKTMPVILNSKAKDLCLKAASYTPKSQITGPLTKDWQRSPRVVTHAVIQRHGRGVLKGDAWDSAWAAKGAQLRNAYRSRGYMRSAFVKAADKFRNILSDAVTTKVSKEGRFTGTEAQVKEATSAALQALARILWDAYDGTDAALKETMVSNALQKSVALVTRDMEKYIARKLEQKAKQVSAK